MYDSNVPETEMNSKCERASCRSSLLDGLISLMPSNPIWPSFYHSTTIYIRRENCIYHKDSTHPYNQCPKQITEHSQTAEALRVPFRSLTALQRVTPMLTSNSINYVSPILTPSATGFVGVERQGELSDFRSLGLPQ